MKTPEERRGIGTSLIPALERLPVLSCYARTRGWHYVISWLHRFTGIGLIILLGVHLSPLTSLPTPDVDTPVMKVIGWPILLFLVWASSLIVGFHALNGCRLILYELFGRRDDACMIRWIFGLSAAYAAMVGLMIVMGNQSVSAFFFWLLAASSGAVAACVVASRIGRKRHSLLWKLQRISGAFLFVTVPAYLLFLYLNPGVADGKQRAVAGVQNTFTGLVFLILAAGVLYHAGYGLFSIAADYTPAGTARAGMTALIVVLVAVLAVLAFRLILSV